MNRRQFVIASLLSLVFVRKAEAGKLKKFRYKIKTKDKSIIHGTIQATDAEDAKHKLRERYPDCEILSLKEES
jgi:hypothetical protein